MNKKSFLIVISLENKEINFPVKVYLVPSEGYGLIKGAEIRNSFCKTMTCTQEELQAELQKAKKHFLSNNLSYFKEHYF